MGTGVTELFTYKSGYCVFILYIVCIVLRTMYMYVASFSVSEKEVSFFFLDCLLYRLAILCGNPIVFVSVNPCLFSF